MAHFGLSCICNPVAFVTQQRFEQHCCAVQQYYRGKDKWEYMPVVGFAKAFDQTEMAKRTRGTLAQPYEAPNPKCEQALVQYKYALNGALPCCFPCAVYQIGLSRLCFIALPINPNLAVDWTLA